MCNDIVHSDIEIPSSLQFPARNPQLCIASLHPGLAAINAPVRSMANWLTFTWVLSAGWVNPVYSNYTSSASQLTQPALR